MEKTREKSFLNIKSKLTAAIAMLLVAFFMVISSSYAWFTLSTAPEVTGIYTKVGANGNLEIALWSGSDPSASAVGDSTKATIKKNLTWGNIIDLKDESYGLSNVSLLPSRLNLALNGTQYQVATAPLLTPTYGSDGRISTLTPNTMTAVYNTSTNSFVSSTADASYGVRAIGTSTTMSQQQIDFRNAKYNISTAVTSAKTKAAQSLTENGSALANILAAKATADDNTTYDLSCAETLITQLEAANNEIEKAIRAYFDALFAIAQQDEEEATYNTNKAALATMTLDELFSDTTYSSLIDTNVTSAYNEYKANVTAIDNARTALGSVTNELTAAKWTDVNSVLIASGLVKIDGAKLNGYTADEVKANMSELVNDVLANGATVTLDDNGGVYSNIAKVCGNYDADIKIPEITYNSLKITNMAAKMKTDVTVNYDIYTSVPTTGPADATSSTSKLTDFYGYAIDLAFRTNVSGSNLMLQTTPTNRIYTDGSGTQDTMGSGSTMTFTSTTTDFTTENVAELMSAIRIIFTDSSNNIVAVGLLDTENATKVGTEVTASLRLCEYTISNVETEGAPDYRIVISTTTTGTGESAVTTINWKDSGEEGKSAIMALTQNQVMRLSAYVYLDGDLVDNTMVANAASSMTGKLNLQFSSDATLVPMNYSPLQNAGSDTTTTTEATTTATTVAP